VSRPWRDDLNVWLAPARLSYGTRALGWRGWRLAGGAIEVTPPPDGPAWRGALEALAAFLGEPSTPRSRVRVVLSNHFVRYAVVPWREDVPSLREREGLVRHAFAEQYGEAVEGWTLREQPGEYGRATLACAVDSALLLGLGAAVRDNGHALARVEPLLMAAFNEHRRQLGGRCALAVTEPGRLCGASFGQGEWQGVFSARMNAPLSREILERETLLAGWPDDAPAFLCVADGQPPPELPPKVSVLRPPARGEPAFAAAWLGCAA